MAASYKSKKKKIEPQNIKAASIDQTRGVSSAPDGLYDPANPGRSITGAGAVA